MAIIRVQNFTNNILNVPVLNILLQPYKVRDGVIVDIDEFYNDDRIQGLMKHPAKIGVTLVQDSTPGSQGDAVLPFYATPELPPAVSNPGMMVYNTSLEAVMYSNGAGWFIPITLPVYSGSLPLATTFPEPYLVYEKNSRSLYVNQGTQWILSKASGIESRPSHQFPIPASVPVGTLLFDSDNEQVKLNDGTRWQLTNNVQDYSTPAGLPALTEVGFGALAFTSRDSTLWVRYASAWRPTTGILRFFATFGDLPTGWANDERGAIAYINDDRAVVVWDGKYWRYMNQLPDYKTSDLPDAADYVGGHMILNGDHIQPLIAWSGSWEGATASAKSYSAATRPANGDLPEGTMIWNTTSNKANFNIGGQWVDALGTVDP